MTLSILGYDTMPEPSFMLKFDGTTSMSGFPPWQVSLTEIMYSTLPHPTPPYHTTTSTLELFLYSFHSNCFRTLTFFTSAFYSISLSALSLTHTHHSPTHTSISSLSALCSPN